MANKGKRVLSSANILTKSFIVISSRADGRTATDVDPGLDLACDLLESSVDLGLETDLTGTAADPRS